MLDEAAALFDVLAHQDGEHLVCHGGVLQRDLQQDALLRVHGGVPEVGGVHLAEPLVPLDGVDVGQLLAGGQPTIAQRVPLHVGVGQLVGRVGPPETEQRRLRQVHVPGIDHGLHEAEQQRQEQRADVRAVHVGVSHQDELVVAQLVDVEVLLDAGAQRVDDGLDLLVRQDAVDAGLLDVQDLAADGQDGLGLRVSATAGRTACGVTLDDEDLTLLRVRGLAVHELAGEATAAEEALAAAGHVACLAGSDAGGGSGLGLADDVLALGRVALEPVAQTVVHHALHEAPRLGVAELGLGLTLELGLGHLDADDGGQALADVVAGDSVLGLLHEAPRLAPPVDGVGQRRAEALLVGAALMGVDGVGERVHAGGVGGVPLHGDLDAHALGLGVCLHGDHRVVDRLLGAGEELHVVDEAVLVAERVVAVLVLLVIGRILTVAGTQVGERDLQALVEERHLAEASGQRVVVVVRGLEDVGRGVERDGGAGFVGLLQLRQVRLGHAHLEGLCVAVAVTLDLDDELLAERVHHGRADAVETAGDLVPAVTELTAGVQHGEHEGHCGDLLDGVFLDGDAAPVVRHPHPAPVEQCDVNLGAVPRECLVD